MASLDYAQSGVDRDAADRFVEKIAVMARSTFPGKSAAKGRVKASIGGYASLFELDKKRWLAASTDGVGTKLKLAFRLKNHRTVGIDLVAMSINDLLCVGAEPLFLDYFATGKLDPGVAEQVLEGIIEGCRQARCALVGGETAEMPEFYSPGEYDLGGFGVGLVDPKRVLPRKEIRPGDALIGIASSGCHSNGYSLLRRLVPQGPEGDALARELLTPTRIYRDATLPLVEKRLALGMAHITGSGFLNVPRMSEKVSYEIELPPLAERAPVFKWLMEHARLEPGEMARTFNLGIGMVIAARKADVSAVLRQIRKSGEKAWEIGRVVPRAKGESCKVRIVDSAGNGLGAELIY